MGNSCLFYTRATVDINFPETTCAVACARFWKLTPGCNAEEPGNTC